MLDSLRLDSFRCFEAVDLPLRGLTLLTGLNGAGKSTLIQALAVLKQTLQSDLRTSQLMLNGPEVTLGSFNRVVHDLTDGTHFAIGVSSGEERLLWTFEGERHDLAAQVAQVAIGGDRCQDVDEFHFLLPTSAVTENRINIMKSIASVTHLTSERPTPQAIHRLELPQAPKSVGRDGSVAVALLHMLRDEVVEQGARHPDVKNPRLIAQVEGWMRHLFPGFRMQVVHFPDSNVVTLGIRLSDATNFHSPAQTGYGLTQVLPVFIAALVSRPGEILAVENPENDLHPRGQALVGEFLCRIAACGVQVLVESHSDHVLNGIRRAVKERTIESGEAIVHFLSTSEDGGPMIDTLEVDENGVIDAWPVGFFDQLERDLEFFAGWDV